MALNKKSTPKQPVKQSRPAAVPPKPAAAPAPSRPSYIKQDNLPDVPMDEGFQPSINIVQMTSLELVKGDPKFIDGAAGGMLFHTGTRELFDGDEGIVLVPVALRKYWTEWVPRDLGGGFVAQYEVKEEMEAQRDPKNEVTPVYEFVCLMEGTEELVRVQFNTPTKYPVARKWATLMQEAGTVCGQKYRLTSVQRQNKQKQPYYSFNVEPAGWATKEEYEVADRIVKSFAVPQIADGGQGM